MNHKLSWANEAGKKITSCAADWAMSVVDKVMVMAFFGDLQTWLRIQDIGGEPDSRLSIVWSDLYLMAVISR